MLSGIAIALAAISLCGTALLAEASSGIGHWSRWRLRACTWIAGGVGFALLAAQTVIDHVTAGAAAWRRGLPAMSGDSGQAPVWIAGALLLGACVLGYRAFQDRRLIVAALWLGVITATQVLLSVASLQGSANHQWVPRVVPGWALLVAGVLGAFVVAEGVQEMRRRHRLAWENPSALTGPTPPWPGFAESCTALGTLLLMVIGLGLAWPVAWSWGGFRMPSLALAGAGTIGAGAFFLLANRRWRTPHADLAQALLTCALCAAVLSALPRNPSDLAERMPARLNALVMVLAGMVGFWMWMARVWAQQLDGGRAWTTAGRLHGQAARFALGSGGFGVCLALLMTIWPRLADMAHRDASFDRMTMGITGHLLLILVLLVGGRRWRRKEFFALAAGGTVSLIAFVVVRTADFVTIVR